MQAPIGSGFGPASTAADVIEGIDLAGKTALVTGGAVGIGLETTRAFALRRRTSHRRGARRRADPRDPRGTRRCRCRPHGPDGPELDRRVRGRVHEPRATAPHLGEQRRDRRRASPPRRARLRVGLRHEPPRALPTHRPPPARAHVLRKGHASSQCRRGRIGSPTWCSTTSSSSGATTTHRWRTANRRPRTFSSRCPSTNGEGRRHSSVLSSSRHDRRQQLQALHPTRGAHRIRARR